MPGLLCGSPRLLDHSFPRSENDLHQVAHALAVLDERIASREIGFVFTDVLTLFYIDFQWERKQGMKYLNEIHTILSSWAILPDGVYKVDVDNVSNFTPHPLPSNSDTSSLTALWSDEIGKLLVKHDTSSPNDFFIGIACESAFCGQTLQQWDNQCRPAARCFPFIGPENTDELTDAYHWGAPPANIHNRSVSLQCAKRNMHLLGGTLRGAQGGSHNLVQFEGARSWPLDENNDPVLDSHLRNLASLLVIPLWVVKVTLVEGCVLPRNQLRL